MGVDAFRVDTAKFVPHDFWNDFFHSTDADAPGILAAARPPAGTASSPSARSSRPPDPSTTPPTGRWRATSAPRRRRSCPRSSSFPLYGEIGRRLRRRGRTHLDPDLPGRQLLDPALYPEPERSSRPSSTTTTCGASSPVRPQRARACSRRWPSSSPSRASRSSTRAPSRASPRPAPPCSRAATRPRRRPLRHHLRRLPAPQGAGRAATRRTRSSPRRHRRSLFDNPARRGRLRLPAHRPGGDRARASSTPRRGRRAGERRWPPACRPAAVLQVLSRRAGPPAAAGGRRAASSP